MRQSTRVIVGSLVFGLFLSLLQYSALFSQDAGPAAVFQVSCSNAMPEDPENLSYALLRQAAAGAVGATRVSWYYGQQANYRNTDSNAGMAFDYMERLVSYGMDFGTSLYDLKLATVPGGSMWMNWTVFNLYGDPSLGLHTSVPRPTHYTVTSSADDGPGTLRWAVTRLADGGEIDFDLPAPARITLTTGPLVVDRPMTIRGPGVYNLTISGGGTQRVFDIAPAGDLALAGVVLADGWAHRTAAAAQPEGGGAVHNAGRLTLNNVQVNSSSADYGGGIHNAGTLTIDGCLLAANQAANLGGGGDGGALFNAGVAAILHSTLTDNRATGGGAVLNWGEGTLNISATNIDSNQAVNGGGIESGDRATLVVDEGSAVSGNIATGIGGGIVIYGGRAQIAGSEVARNFANAGGGLYLVQGTADLSRTNVTGNQIVTPATAQGAGIFLAGGTLTVVESAVSENVLRSTHDPAEPPSGPGNKFGAGLYMAGGTLTVTSSTFAQNRTGEATVGAGGGLYLAQGQAALSHCTLTGNTARGSTAGEGGAIYNAWAELTLDHCTLQGNTAASFDTALGGGVYNGGVLAIQYSTLQANTVSGWSSYGGSALYGAGGSAHLFATTVSGNVADGHYSGSGGALLNNAELLVENCTISGNQGNPPGTKAAGIYSAGNTTLRSVTIAGNVGYLSGGLSGPATLVNTILAGNTANSPERGNCAAAVTSAGHNLDSDGSCGLTGPGDISGQDPLLGPLQDNGGPTSTHALTLLSPALDAGDADQCRRTGFDFDQRGPHPDNPQEFARSVDGNADGSSVCDVGAYEVQVAHISAPVVNSTDDPGAGVCDEAECTLREAILAANAAGGGTIRFNIGGTGPFSLKPLAPLPELRGNITVDGYSQPGAAPNTNPAPGPFNGVLLIELDGSLTSGNGLTVGGGGTVIRGLVINRFTAAGIEIRDSDNPAANLGDNLVAGNLIGVEPSGLARAPNDQGIVSHIYNPIQVTVGGPTPADRNIIAANTKGGLVCVYARTIVQGNLVGVAADGQTLLGNGGTGVYLVRAHDVLRVQDNVIAGNDLGLSIQEARTRGEVTGNIVGFLAPDSTPQGNTGTGVLLFQSDLLLRNNRIVGNGGRGLEVWKGIGLDLQDTEVTHNQGGGIYLDFYDRVTISGGRIADNRADNGAGLYVAGAMGASNARVVLDHVTLTGNRSAFPVDCGKGGALYTELPVEIIAARFADNFCGNGGAVYVAATGAITVSDSTFVDNEARFFGGALYNEGAASVASSTFNANNEAIFNSGSFTLTNSTVSGNIATRIAAGLDNLGTAALANATLADKVANRGALAAHNTIFGDGCAADPAGSTITSLGHNLDRDGSCALSGPGDSVGDPLFGPLQDNGGPTWTHALLACSPALDAGDTALCTMPYDQRGPNPANPAQFARRVDGTADDGVNTPVCDSGAFEAQALLTCPITPKYATITVVKDAVPDANRNFRFFGAFGVFRLDDPGFDDADGISRSITYDAVLGGTHTFADDLPFRWHLGSIVCEPAVHCQVDLTNRSVAVTVAAGDRVTVTFTNLQKGSLLARAYWDKNGDGRRQGREPLMEGWWTELYDLTLGQGQGSVTASGFTNANGKFNVLDLIPGHDYKLCQKPQPLWTNTQPGRSFFDDRTWPCYTFTLQPAQAVEVWFGYAEAGSPAAEATRDNTVAAEGLTIRHGYRDPEQDAMYTKEEFVDQDALTPIPTEEEDEPFRLYLPTLEAR